MVGRMGHQGTASRVDQCVCVQIEWSLRFWGMKTGWFVNLNLL